VGSVLGETKELAGPHFLCVIVVDDGIVRFQAAMVEHFGAIAGTRILVVGKVCSIDRSPLKASIKKVRVTNRFPRRQPRNLG
jgi:hypothetical protein